MDQYSINGEIEKMQGLLGVKQDGILGWNTREALKKFKEDNNKAKGLAGYQLNKVRDEFDDSVIKDGNFPPDQAVLDRLINHTISCGDFDGLVPTVGMFPPTRGGIQREPPTMRRWKKFSGWTRSTTTSI